MPIRITKYAHPTEDPKGQDIAWLCNDSWRLPNQLGALEDWLQENKCLPKGFYAADIGFAPREDAFGGGASLTPESMHIMASIGMELFFSEYPDGLND